ncbi:hypothetical protein B0T17DRAFT_613192 [Bombardia bombarda]|uniref:Developmentally Regulated MAPK Interacting protein n=1 Tax=Bombardia bombarda TaxID=252184 RepID=A0AA39XNW7_9PEZI|nr:hypothetical protein B0T17DRAFT_613192 [Bombardia bombarda]
MKCFAIVAAFAAAVSAISITEPAEKTAWDFSKSNKIEWTSVSTDVTEFKLVLYDGANSYTLDNFVAAPGSQYKVKAIGIDKTNTGSQLSESPTFNVTKSGVASSSTTTGPTSSTTGAPTGTDVAPAATTTKSGAAALAASFGVVGPLAVIVAMFL